MDTRFPAHRTESAIAMHLEDDFLDAVRALRQGDRLRLPPVTLDEPRVHAMQIERKKGGFVAARAGANLDDAVTLVERVARDEEGHDRALDARDRCLQPVLLSACFRGHLGIINANELAHLRELVLIPLEAGRHFLDRGEPAMLPSQLREPARISRGRRIGQLALDLRRPRHRVGETIANAQRSLPYFWRKRSTRPAVSTSFCLPV
jgi:hypothetical protein